MLTPIKRYEVIPGYTLGFGISQGLSGCPLCIHYFIIGDQYPCLKKISKNLKKEKSGCQLVKKGSN